MFKSVNIRAIENGYVVSSCDGDFASEEYFLTFKEAKKCARALVKCWSEEDNEAEGLDYELQG